MIKDYARGKLALEIGSYDGGTAREIAHNCDHVICVDCFINTGGDGITPILENFLAYTLGYPNISLFKSYSENLWLFQSAQFDFIFVDGSHKEPTVSSDINHSLRLLKYDGRLAIHDIGRYPELDKAFLKIEGFPCRIQTESLVVMSNVPLIKNG